MKKIVYSFYTKMIVCILCGGSLLYALNIGLDGMNKWNQYKTEVYHFEDHFEDGNIAGEFQFEYPELSKTNY